MDRGPLAAMRMVHDRNGTASRSVSTAVAAARWLPNGPSAPSRAVVTTDNRGNASLVGTTHQPRSTCRERRL